MTQLKEDRMFAIAAQGVKFGIGFIVSWVLGLQTVIQFLLVLMVIDLLTGLIAGAMQGSLSSNKAWGGLGKKVVILGLVTVGEFADHLVIGNPASPLGLGEVIAGFYCAHEGLSIVENAALIGLPVPKALAALFEKLNPEKFDEPPAVNPPGGGMVG